MILCKHLSQASKHGINSATSRRPHKEKVTVAKCLLATCLPGKLLFSLLNAKHSRHPVWNSPSFNSPRQLIKVPSAELFHPFNILPVVYVCMFASKNLFVYLSNWLWPSRDPVTFIYVFLFSNTYYALLDVHKTQINPSYFLFFWSRAQIKNKFILRVAMI